MWRVVALLAVLLSGCATYHPFQPKPGEREWAPTTQRGPAVKTVNGDGSLMANASLLTLFQDRRAYRTGDILTVVLDEETQSSKRANTNIGKDSNTTVATPSLLGKTFPKAAVGLDAQRDFNGAASASQQNTLTGSITVTVAEVLPSGALRIQGEKWIQLNQGDEYIRLSGLVRVEDIDLANRISSQRIADARIAYSGRGALAEANEQGWVGRFFNSGWFPF